MTVSEPVAKWCCNGDPERADKPVGDRGHAPTCRYHESNYAPSNPPPARAEPSRGAPDAAAERLARFIAQKESLNCKTLDDAVHHQSKWQRIVPEAKEMLEAAYPDGTGHVVLLEALRRLTAKLNLIHKDQGYIGVFQLAMLHGMTYTGPNYEADLREAEAAIKQAERA